MLGPVEVGAGQAESVVGDRRVGAPYLRPIDDPAVAVPICPGERSGEIRTGAGFRQQLDPLSSPRKIFGRCSARTPGDAQSRSVGAIMPRETPRPAGSR